MTQKIKGCFLCYTGSMKNKKIALSVLILIVVLGCATYFFYAKNKNSSPTDKIVVPLDSAVVYNNADYGFTFSLPVDWKGYSIVQNTWQGDSLTGAVVNETGPKLLIRNPKWTSALYYEDIPIIIFTLAQWNSYTAGNFAVSAAPIPATELGRNNFYVFALPPRWDFDYSQGFKEAENILASHPLKTFNPILTQNQIDKTDLIRVDTPLPNQIVSSPLVIKGEARGSWFFEATFPVILTNWDGLIIAQGVARAKGDWTTTDFVPFEATLTFTVDKKAYSNKGALTLKKDNPSGLPQNDNSIEIPVIFAK
jgi:Immunoglobulin-like domain of bacterial spore germination